jgi:hypothetical protein
MLMLRFWRGWIRRGSIDDVFEELVLSGELKFWLGMNTPPASALSYTRSKTLSLPIRSCAEIMTVLIVLDN